MSEIQKTVNKKKKTNQTVSKKSNKINVYYCVELENTNDHFLDSTTYSIAENKSKWTQNVFIEGNNITCKLYKDSQANVIGLDTLINALDKELELQNTNVKLVVNIIRLSIWNNGSK